MPSPKTGKRFTGLFPTPSPAENAANRKANKDQPDTLKACVDSIREKSTYGNYEIIIIENNSTGTEIFSLYEELKLDPRIRVAVWERDFNYPAINNFGASLAQGEFLLLLNNDTRVITPDWMEELLGTCLLYTSRCV